eukprot:m.527607 g.527607  ORF g.527607 m.527607 type:complete len:770 (-) comp22012_c0_seq3:281-2590(-)
MIQVHVQWLVLLAGCIQLIEVDAITPAADVPLKVPAHVPNVWGGSARGVTGMTKNSGQMFAYSGADGSTQEGSGFVGLYQPQLYQIQFLAGDAVLDLGLSDGKQTDTESVPAGYILAATSDVIAVASKNQLSKEHRSKDENERNYTQSVLPEIVTTYQAWDMLVGYAPSVELKGVWRDDHILVANSTGTSSTVCNISGKWHDHSEYVITEGADGSFSVVSLTPHSWARAAGFVNLANGSLTITYDNGKVDHAIIGDNGQGCSEIHWLSSFGGTWFRDAGPTPAGVTCTSVKHMTLCTKAAGGSTMDDAPSVLFALVFNDASGRAADAVNALTTSAVHIAANAKLATLAALPPVPATWHQSTGSGSSPVKHSLSQEKSARPTAAFDYDRVAAKVYSVMRVNTLSPEGIAPVHWSTPDKTPHQAMWLWDSCFHAIGRCIVEPHLAWEFLEAMLRAAAADGHVPIQAEPWNGQLSGDTQPPLLTLATSYVRMYGGVNDSQLRWAVPRLERYLLWDIANRDRDGNGLFEWDKGTESGLDNSPVFDSYDGTVASIDFSVYMALEMQLLARLQTTLGNTTAAQSWEARANRTTEMIHSALWDSADKFYYYRDQNGTGDFIKIKIASGFAPLLLDGISDERVAQLLVHLNNPNEFATAAPLPTVSKDDATYCTNMWRGPAWTNTNWFTILGLRKYSHVPGALEAADRLQRSTINTVAKYYEQFGTTFEFYDSSDVTPPTKLERKGSLSSGGVRDYHWTAANIFWMLYSPNGTLPNV